jgi:glycosyltransferase involved in cell wall biosynthesis
MRRRGAQVSYLGQVTGSQTLNLLLLPMQTAAGRLGGARMVHLHWVYAFSLPGSNPPIARRAAEVWFTLWLWTVRLLGMRLVWTAHNVLPQSPVFANDLRARRRLVGSSDLVIAHSTATLEQLAALGVVPRRSAVIPHGPFTGDGAEPGRLHPPGHGGHTRQLLFFGKIAPYKGVDALLEAFAALPPELDGHLTVAGECGDPALAAELTELAGRSLGRVTLRLGWCPAEDASRLLRQADVMVLPFRKITTSGSAMLALGHGLPLVVPDLPGLAGLPDDAVVRYDGTTRGLRGALADLIVADPTVLAKLSSAAQAYCATSSWDEIAGKTLAEIASGDGKRNDRAGA